MRYYTTESLGPHQELTPEGYLLAKGVPIARTGTMLYAAGEVPVSAVNGLIKIDRSAEDVFAQAAIDSFEGKPITLDHPSVDVDPANWSKLAKGVVQNVRRGTGLEDDFFGGRLTHHRWRSHQAGPRSPRNSRRRLRRPARVRLSAGRRRSRNCGDKAS
jgi:hypothetical protein